MLKQAERSHFTDLSYNSVVISSNKAASETLAPVEDVFLSFVSNHLQTGSYHASLMTVIEADGLDTRSSSYCHGNL